MEPLRQQAIDIFQPSIIKLGGVSEYLPAIEQAATERIAVIPHTPYFGPGFYASLQTAAARPAVEALEYNFVRPDAWLSGVEGLRHGSRISVPGGPGIGFEPDLEVLQRYRRK